MICVENQKPCSSVMNDYHIDEAMTFETVVVGGTGVRYAARSMMTMIIRVGEALRGV